MMVKKEILYCSLLFMLLTAAAPQYAFAQQSPEHAYSAGKWESLRDDCLEFDEIAELIHEYNPTVLQNAITYRQQRDKTAEEVAQEYYDAADQAFGSLSVADSDSENYASSLTSYINNKKNAEKLLEQGDNSTDNAQTYKLTYDQAEATLVKQAQAQMITYYSQKNSLEGQQAALEQAERDAGLEEKRLAAGLSTQASVRSAQQKADSARATLITAQSSLEKTRQNLLLMMGWAYGAEVSIGELPQVDWDAIASIDLKRDMETARNENYSLKKINLQLQNAHSEKSRDSLTASQKSAEQAISNDVSVKYQTLMTTVSSYEQAEQSCETQRKALETAQRKRQAGIMTEGSFQTAASALKTAEVTLETRRLAVLTAYYDYQWAVKGLASAG